MISCRGTKLAELEEYCEVSSGKVVTTLDECNSVGAGSTLFGSVRLCSALFGRGSPDPAETADRRSPHCFHAFRTLRTDAWNAARQQQH